VTVSYKTLAKEANAGFIEKKSAFAGYGSPAKSEEVARAFIDKVRRANPQANHVCYAYIIGTNIQRMSDAGEPSGTAGTPILETLKTRGLTNCSAAVVRIFGGVLLGARGLARAYGRACSMAIDACGVCVMEPTDRMEITIPYSLWDTLRHAMKGTPCEWADVEYAADIRATLRVRSADSEGVLDRLRDASNGRITVAGKNTQHEPWNEVSG